MSFPNLLDTATKIAISAIKPKKNEQKKDKKAVDFSTINGLLAFLQTGKNVNELLLYIMRQTGRGEIDKDTGMLLLQSLKDKQIEEALTLLGYVRWIYETLDGLKVKYESVENIKEFMRLVEFLSQEEAKE